MNCSVAQTQTPTRVIFLPKNRGLAAQTEAACVHLAFAGDPVCSVRGEDVPHLASRAAARGQDVCALTGEDLLEEWLAAGNVLDPRLRRESIAWRDPAAIFGKPALCLIGPPRRTAGQELSVGICARYARLAERFLRKIETAGTIVHRSYFQGALETVAAARLTDAVIDIVLTGRSIAEYGLCVYELISTSDLAVLTTP